MAGLAAALVVLAGASCDRKQKETTPVPGAATPGGNTEPAPDVDVPGVDVSKLDTGEKRRFAQALDALPSPCGKAHSLRTSLTSDPGCKRAVFAGRYVARLATEGFVPEEIEYAYEARFQQTERKTLPTENAPYAGVRGARVELVEFFDYGCIHCKGLETVLDDVLASHPSDVVLYYKHFPLAAHKDSVPAAMAAVAAQRQGKFKDMHRKLFDNQRAHGPEALLGYARAIGLDMKKFEADMSDDAIRSRVLADKQLGEDLEIQGTPTLYINGREYTDAFTEEMISDWIREELAMNSQPGQESKP